MTRSVLVYRGGNRSRKRSSLRKKISLFSDKEHGPHGRQDQPNCGGSFARRDLGRFLVARVRIPNSQRMASTQGDLGIDRLRRRVREEVDVASVLHLVDVG